MVMNYCRPTQPLGPGSFAGTMPAMRGLPGPSTRLCQPKTEILLFPFVKEIVIFVSGGMGENVPQFELFGRITAEVA